MKFKRIFLVALAMVTSVFAGLAMAAGGEGALIVHVTGLKNNNGVVRIAMYNSPQAYQDTTQSKGLAFKSATLPISGGQATWKVENVPYGVYAIKLFHDETLSGKLKKSMIGKPTEGFGFSNNPKFQNRAPTFDEVKFTVEQPTTSMDIRVINL